VHDINNDNGIQFGTIILYITQLIKLYIWLFTHHPQAIHNEKLVYNMYNKVYCQVKPRLSTIFYVRWLNVACASW
jgi:hypothetical protein